MIRRALETQEAGLGFSFVEILTMCPTGWFIETPDAPDYLTSTLAPGPRARRAQGRAADGVTTSSSPTRGTSTTRSSRRCGTGFRPSRSSPSRTSGVSVITSRTAPTSSPTPSARCGRAPRRRSRSISRRTSASSRPVCAGCRRSGPGSTISTAWSSRRACVVTNAAGVAAAPIAEFAIGRLLAVWKRFDEIDEQQRDARLEARFGTPGRGAHPRDHRAGRDRHRGRGPRPRLRHDDHRHAPELPARSGAPGGRRAPRHRRPARRARPLRRGGRQRTGDRRRPRTCSTTPRSRR